MRLLLLVLLLCGSGVIAQELQPLPNTAPKSDGAIDPAKLDDEDFIELARRALISTSWIKMSGNLNTRPAKAKRARYSIEIAAEIRPQKLVFKTTLADDQSVKVQHIYGDEHETKVLEPNTAKEDLYKQLMIKPQDLSLSFMYWDMMKEYKSESLGITRLKCRVFLMANPDISEANPEPEYAKVWISEKYLGPVKVMWCKGEIDFDKPQQILEFEGFTEKNKVWMPADIYIKNSFGEMQIKLKDHDGAFGPNSPKNLFGDK